MKRQTQATNHLTCGILLSFILACCVSCATPGVQGAPQQRDLLFAEHSTMKKRLPLIERENDVLTKENAHYRERVRDLEQTLRQLNADMAAARDDHAREIAAKSDRIDNLEMSMQQRNEEIASLNTAILTREQAFAAQREQLIEQKKQQAADFAGQLAQKETVLAEQTREIEALMTAKADLETVLENRGAQIDRLSAANKDLEAVIDGKSRKIDELAAAHKQTEKKLNDTTEMIAALKKDREKSMAELESARAANAEMTKTFNELFNQLQLKKDQSGTKI